MEQPQKYRPQAMHIGSEYLGFDYGTKTRTKALVLGFGSHHHGGFHHGSLHTGLSTGNVTSKTTILGERIYHSSVSNISLFKKGNYYFAAISDGSGKITKRIYSLSEKKAKRFADAMYYFINNAPDNFK
ncbi:hypothetical protein A9Q99_19900 [Gammaproteobacteria bacterium 45_16_T64]|nr:hypothetical protein A9Q99_19900 [Gammaproteobacteria bacterium 45_16_T64]